MSRNLAGLLVSGALVIGAPVIGLVVTVLFLRGAFGEVANPGVDASQRASVLSEGISNAMSGAACGLVVSVLALVPTVVFALRLHRGAKRDSSVTAK